jgi:hypothetical protein
MPFPIPNDTDLRQAAELLRSAASYFREAADASCASDTESDCDEAFRYLQDALAILGQGMSDLPSPPPATAEALFDDAAYAAGRGQL